MSGNNEPAAYEHGGMECRIRQYWVGNPRDGHWESAYWYFDNSPEYGGLWRYCGVHNTRAINREVYDT